MSEDHRKYIQEMPDSHEKKMLELITSQHSEQFVEELKKLKKKNRALWDSLESYKATEKVLAASNAEDVEYILKDLSRGYERQLNYSKPADLQMDDGGNQGETQKLASELETPKDYKGWAEEKVRENENEVKSFSDYGVKQISEATLMKMKLNNKEHFLSRSRILRTYPPAFIAKFIRSFYDEIKALNKTYEFPAGLIHSLSIRQLEALKVEIPNLVNHATYLKSVFNAKFAERFEVYRKPELTISEKDEKRKLLFELKGEIETMDSKRLLDYKDKLEKEILVLDISRENIEEELFFSFIEKNLTSLANEKQQKLLRGKKGLADQVELDFELACRHWDNNELAREYIKRLIGKNEDMRIVEKLKNYFQQEVIDKTYVRVKLLQGADASIAENVLEPEEVAELRERKELTILAKNKKFFDVEDDIVLSLKVKNIAFIKVKLYELDLQKLYLLEKKGIDAQMSTSYLHPTRETEQVVERGSGFVEKVVDLKIEEEQKKRAVYIVELESESVSSRALIRKGGIAFIKEVKTDGVELKFYDEKGQRLSDLELWFGEQKKYVRDSYLIPFEPKGSKNH